jgi:hypothetical protein
MKYIHRQYKNVVTVFDLGGLFIVRTGYYDSERILEPDDFHKEYELFNALLTSNLL